MTQIIVVDTDILIDTSRGIADAIACLQDIEAGSRVVVSSISEMELIVGCRNRNELQTLEQFLKRFEVVKVNETIGDIALDLLKHIV